MGKADKLLGIDNAVTTETSINIQHSGYLFVKEGEKRSLNNPWKKRYCVVKDGFFLWYSSDTKNGFDRKPRGIFPLNGAWVNHVLDSGDGRLIELIHPDIAHANFILRADSEVVARDWAYCFENSKKATWENAQLGHAMLEQIKKGGEKKESEKSDAVKALEDKVKQLNKEQEDKVRILKREAKQVERIKKKMDAQEDALLKQAESIAAMEAQIKQEEKVHEEAAVKRKDLQTKLKMVELTLRKLEETFIEEFKGEGKGVDLGAQVKSSVAALRGFFEETIEAHREKQMRYIGKKLNAIKATMKRNQPPPPQAPPPAS